MTNKILSQNNSQQKQNIEEKMQKTVVVWLGALVCCLLWGSAFPCIKLGYGFSEIAAGDTASQILYAGMRFTLAGVAAITIGSIMKRKFIYPQAEAVPKVLSLSLFQTVLQYMFFYIGLAHTTGVKASIIEGMNVFVVVFVSGVLLKMEHVGAGKIIGCIIGFARVVLVNITGSGIDMNMHLNGEGFILLSTVAYAFSSVLLKRYSKKYDPVMLSGYQFIIGGVIMTAAGLILGGHIKLAGAASVAMLIYLALVSAVAYSLWGILLKYNPVSKVSVFGFMNPVFGVLLSAVLLREDSSLGINAIIALVLVCAGIYIVNKAPGKKLRKIRSEK